MPHALVGLGANLGPRQATLEQATRQLGQLPRTALVAVSRWLTTVAVGGPSGQPEFLNGAALLQTELSPEQLLDALLAIEASLGRQRGAVWDARPIDLDLLLYGDEVIRAPRLVVPHPRMAWRRFVLQPAVEVAGNWRHPTIGWTLAELLRHLKQAPPYLALTGADADANRQLARRVVQRSTAQLLEPAPTAAPPRDDQLPAGQRHLLKVQACLQVLQNTTPATAHDDWLVSPFWLEALLVCDDDGPLEPELAARCETLVGESRRRCLQPKLLAVISPSSRADAALAARLNAAQQAIARQVTRRYQGPCVVLSHDQFEAAVDELAAALAAMR